MLIHMKNPCATYICVSASVPTSPPAKLGPFGLDAPPLDTGVNYGTP